MSNKSSLNRLSLLGPTKEKMLYELKGGKKTAKDLSESLNIQVSAARKHLETMRELGIVREEFIQEGIGRPKKFYFLTEEALEFFPRQYEKVLCSLLDRLEGSQNRTSESIMKQIASQISSEMKLESDTMHSLVENLTAFGFDATLEETKSSFVIASHNCPVFNAAVKHQKLMCHSLHDEIIKSALGIKDIRLEKSVARGDGACRHVIEKRV
ncbi:MAG: helix-turn-helix transcriptional regulator [Nitrososphaerales archaeon]